MKNDLAEKNYMQKILKKKINPLKNNNKINNNLICENREKNFDNINIFSNKNFTFNTQIKDQLNNSSLKSSNEENLANNKEKIDHKLNFNFNFNFPPTPNNLNFNLLKKKRNKFKENSLNKKKNINLNLNLNLNVNSNSLDISENKAKNLVNRNLNISNQTGLPKILLNNSYVGNNKEDCLSQRNEEINNFSNEGNKYTEKKKNILNSDYEKKISQNLINNKLNLDEVIDLKKNNKISAEDYCFDFNLLDVKKFF